jgi:alcohol dehydrogenase
MKAAVMHQFETPLVLEHVPDPVPPEDGVVIQVMANGICRSDWHAWMGHDPAITLPHVPGHELAGVVVDAGPKVRNWRAGDRVTVPFCCGCGACEQCRAGHTHICDRDFQPGFTAWGAFAQYVAVPHADLNAVRLPDALDFVEAASLGCRFMTAFGALVDKARVRAGEWVAVHGCGGVGLSAVHIAAALGALPIGIDIESEKLELARALGAVHVVNARDTDPADAVRELTNGGAHVSVDALGSAVTCRNAVRSLRKRGRHVQVGLMLERDREAPVPMAEVIAKELVILGSHGMQAHRYDEMLRLIVQGKLEPRRMIGKRVTLEDAGAELAAMGAFAQRGVTVIDRF